MSTIISRGRHIQYACGCVNRTDDPSGVLRSVSKCAKHKARQRDPNTLDQAYYEELGTLRNGEPWDSPHVGELVEALGPLPKAPAGGIALEIGGGVSPYVEAIHSAGWRYFGVEPSAWATSYMAARWDYVCFYRGVLDATKLTGEYGLALAAHVLEHMEDAPGAIKQVAGVLAPGGELWIVVPDDSDPINPDHLAFFTEATLRDCLEAAGLVVERIMSFRRVAHEAFVYARARKPA